MCAKHETIFRPLTSPIQPPKPGCWDQNPLGVKKLRFFNNPHICVFEMISATRAFLRSVCWGTRDPSLAASPPPPFQGAKMFRGCRCQGLHLGAPHA